MIEKVVLIRAEEKDAKTLTELLIRVYHDDINRWGKTKEEGFIPGYDSEDMQKFYMKIGHYFKILCDENLVGMALVTYNGGYHARIDRLYIDSEYQGKHTGTKVMNLIEDEFPKVKIWTLDTYKKPERNAYFYEKLGYEKQWEDDVEISYKKEIRDEEIKAEHKEENISNEKYIDCNMRESDFYGVSLSRSKFEDVGMSEVTIQNATINKAIIANANLTGAVIGDVKMDKVEICHASLGGAYIHDTNLGWFEEKTPINFERCDFKDSKFKDCDFSGVELEACNIKDMRISGRFLEELIMGSQVEEKVFSEDLIQCIFKRRSIRRYKNKEVDKEILEILMKAGMAAPTACNNQPWEFIAIREKETMDKLREKLVMGRYNAPAAIVVCGNMDLAKGGMKHHWDQDCSAALENILLAATALGLGSIWIGVYPLDNFVKAVRQALNLPEHVIPLGIAYVGYADEDKEPRTQYNEKRVYWKQYDNDRKHRARPKNLKYGL